MQLVDKLCPKCKFAENALKVNCITIVYDYMLLGCGAIHEGCGGSVKLLHVGTTQSDTERLGNNAVVCIQPLNTIEWIIRY